MPQFSFKQYKIHYQVEGNGPLVVFLHGWPSNSMLWKAQREVLKKNYTVLSLDWLGFGRSSKPTDIVYTFQQKKAILETLLNLPEFQQYKKLSLVAHDIGGPPTILWAHEHAARVEHLILLNTVIYPFKTTLDKLSHILFNLPIIKNILMSQFGLNSIVKKGTRSKHKNLNPTIKELLEVYQDVPHQVKLKTILEPLDQGAKDTFLQLSQIFQEIDVPKSFIIAKQDPLCFKHIDKLRTENPNVPTHYIQNCGHYIPIDQPDALNQILVKILENQLSNISN